MLTVFLGVQTGVNLLLLLGLFLLWRERRMAGRLALAREDRLEALAADFCSLGEAVVASVGPTEAEALRPEPDGAARSRTTNGREDGTPSPPRVVSGLPDPLESAVTLLEQGFSVETVAARTAIPDGELQVLRNLRRAQAPAAGPRRGRRSPATGRRQVAADAETGVR